MDFGAVKVEKGYSGSRPELKEVIPDTKTRTGRVPLAENPLVGTCNPTRKCSVRG